MIQVDLEPKVLIANQANDLTIRLSNHSNGPCTNLVFKIKLPVDILLLNGRDRIEHPRLNAGENITQVLCLSPKKIGTCTLSAVNFSYRNSLGHANRIYNLRFELTVKAQDKQLAKTDCKIVIDNNEFPFNKWEMLKGKIVNTGTTTFRKITLRVDGSGVTDSNESSEIFDSLLPGKEIKFKIPIRINESGNTVPIRIKINYIDELEQESQREFRYLLNVDSQPSPFRETRKEDLANNIREDLNLLKEYEDALRYEDDPRRRAKYRKEIEDLRKSYKFYKQELKIHEATTNLETPSEIGKATELLKDMDDKLTTLQADHASIKIELEEMRMNILAHFKKSENIIISTFIDKLNKNDLKLTNSIFNALDLGRLSEADLQKIHSTIKESFVELKQCIKQLPDPAYSKSLDKTEEILSKHAVDLKHRLKIALPIIPFILNYESELELNTKENLKKAWNKLLSKIKYKK